MQQRIDPLKTFNQSIDREHQRKERKKDKIRAKCTRDNARAKHEGTYERPSIIRELLWQVKYLFFPDRAVASGSGSGKAGKKRAKK